MVQLSHPNMTIGKTIALTIWTLVGKAISLLFNTLSRFFIAFLPRSKCLLISWLVSPSPMILEPKKIVCHCFHCFPIYLLWSGMIFIFWMLCFKPAFSFFSLIFIRRLLSSSLLSVIRVVSYVYLLLLIFLLTILILACDSSSPEFHIMYTAHKLN